MLLFLSKALSTYCEVGEDVHFPCQSLENVSFAILFWKKSGKADQLIKRTFTASDNITSCKTYSDSDRYYIPPKVNGRIPCELIIRNVELEDQGNYSCKITRSGRVPIEWFVTLFVNGKYKPKIIYLFLKCQVKFRQFDPENKQKWCTKYISWRASF